jgi:ankyrin repeat protein
MAYVLVNSPDSTFLIGISAMIVTQADSLSPIDRFKRAVHKRDASALRRVLEESAEARAAINEPMFSFDSPALASVAGDGDLALVDTLLEFGADPNRKSSWWAGGFHPLHSAEGAVADRLIAVGAEPDACAAARLDRLDLLAKMLKENPARVHERGGDGQTPLHFARSRAAVDLLLDAGADPDARDMDHRSTAAEWMIGDMNSPASRTELAKYLVERGASADIFLAAALGLTERARELLEADPALLNQRTSQGDYDAKPPSSNHIYTWTLGANLSPLQVAAERGQGETLAAMRMFASPAEQLLLACHLGKQEQARTIARDNPGIVQQLGPVERRALADEALGANVPAVEIMLELGFDPAIERLAAGNALHCAAWEGSVDCVSAILAHPSGKTIIEWRDSAYRGTPLSWCCHGSRNCGNPVADHGEVARLLVAAGASLDKAMIEWDCSEGMRAAIAELRRS